MSAIESSNWKCSTDSGKEVLIWFYYVTAISDKLWVKVNTLLLVWKQSYCDSFDIYLSFLLLLLLLLLNKRRPSFFKHQTFCRAVSTSRLLPRHLRYRSTLFSTLVHIVVGFTKLYPLHHPHSRLPQHFRIDLIYIIFNKLISSSFITRSLLLVLNLQLCTHTDTHTRNIPRNKWSPCL